MPHSLKSVPGIRNKRIGPNRRRLLGGLSASLAAWHLAGGVKPLFASALNRPRLGVIGCGSRWGWQLANGGKYGVGPDFARFGDYVAVCDVDQDRVDAAADLVASWGSGPARKTIDYADILARDDIDAVLIFTPDHWHAKIAIEAMRAGKDVYCEKPMTLTIDEGKRLRDAVASTRRVMQVGTQQRSNHGFLTAVAMIREGRIGTLRRITCGIGGGPASPAIPVATPPKGFDWNRWLGPVAEVDFRYLPGAENETGAWSNNHYEFRWWYEFSGGKLTDWGAHHVDIATWAIGGGSAGELKVNPIAVEHPVEFVDGNPVERDRYNTATSFEIRVQDPSGVEMLLSSSARNGVLFEGDRGRMFVNRRTLAGSRVDELKTRPLPDGAIDAVYKNRPFGGQADRFDSLGHVNNFFAAMQDRADPISDVASHHTALTTCHLAGIAARLGRTIRYDRARETIVGDRQAASMMKREYRNGFQ